MSTLPLIRHGVRWRIGNGHEVRIFRDPWIPRDYAHIPFTPDLYDLGDATVSNLLDEDTGGWNVTLVNTIFWEEDANVILSIPVTNLQAVDLRVWHYTKHGFYSVRSAYYLARILREKDRQQNH